MGDQISIVEYLHNSLFSGVVKSGVVDAFPHPPLVNAVTVISDTIVPGNRDGMMKVVAGSMVLVITGLLLLIL